MSPQLRRRARRYFGVRTTRLSDSMPDRDPDGCRRGVLLLPRSAAPIDSLDAILDIHGHLHEALSSVLEDDGYHMTRLSFPDAVVPRPGAAWRMHAQLRDNRQLEIGCEVHALTLRPWRRVVAYEIAPAPLDTDHDPRAKLARRARA